MSPVGWLKNARTVLIRLELVEAGGFHHPLVRHAEELRVARRLVLELRPRRYAEIIAALPGDARVAGNGLAAAFHDAEDAVGRRALAPCLGARSEPLHLQQHGRHGRRLEGDARPVEAFIVGDRLVEPARDVVARETIR